LLRQYPALKVVVGDEILAVLGTGSFREDLSPGTFVMIFGWRAAILARIS
jgi:hypothetical protein